jgi:histone demethylase JARID1
VQAERYGVCRIVPPPGWAVPLALDKAAFKLSTRIQAVHRLQDRLALPAQQAFYEDLRAFSSADGRGLAGGRWVWV